MTLEEAKEFYFQYRGFTFHMFREEPSRFAAYRRLDPGKDILRKWDEEILDGLFQRFWSDPEHVWVTHGNILDIIRRKHCDAHGYLLRLLDEMDRMDGLDPQNATLIVENMAGRNEPQTDGGVCVFCSCADLAERMNDVTERLIAAWRQNNDADERFENAVTRYRKAWKMFSAAH